MKRQMMIMALLLMTAVTGFAQKVSIENVVKPFKTEFGAIKEGTEVKGYYFFWISDRIEAFIAAGQEHIGDLVSRACPASKRGTTKKFWIIGVSQNNQNFL